MTRRILISAWLLIVFISRVDAAERNDLTNFIVKENLLKNDKLAVIAADENEQPIELNGIYLFTINGFKQDLKFNDGVAVTSQPIEKSTFIYLKHKSDSATINKLYYILKSEESLNPIKVSLKLLVLIPILIVVIISMFRRFFIYGIIVLAGFIYFNFSRGLSLPTYFETIFDGIRSLFD